MKTSGFKIKDYIIAILLAVVFILSASVLLLMNKDAETSASIPTETSIETEPASELNHSLLEDMESGKSFCFVGDSITRGSVTDDIPWYEAIHPRRDNELLGWRMDIYVARGSS